jgi:hypothetical protein
MENKWQKIETAPKDGKECCEECFEQLNDNKKMKTTSYKISKQLAEAGFKAKTDFCWYRYNNLDGSPNIELSYIGDNCDMDSKPMQPPLDERATLCFDLETILEALPRFIKCGGYSYCLIFWFGGGWLYYELIEEPTEGIDFFKLEIEKDKNESLADTAARLWLQLKENGII